MHACVQAFLDRRWDRRSPLLLGLSGGPDSLALLYLLIEQGLPLHVAHVDHGWRSESAAEAAQLSALVHSLGLPFHTKRLEPLSQGNKEAQAREERLQFFRELSSTLGCQAVCLGHHADDLAETALKRVMEGASLHCLGGMRDCTEIEGVTLWRPLLTISKEQILQFIQERGLQPFDDATNRDECFLRARLRNRILPDLSHAFGKEVKRGLCYVAQEAHELRDYLEERVGHLLSQQVKGPFGVMLDISQETLHHLELRYLVRRLCEEGGITPRRDLVATVCELLCEGAADRRVEQGERFVYVDRGRLFVVERSFKARWKYCEGDQAPVGWLAVWRGHCGLLLPEGCRLAPPDLKVPLEINGKAISLNKWWTDHKVPALLRYVAPVVWKEGKIVGELLCHTPSISGAVQWDGCAT